MVKKAEHSRFFAVYSMVLTTLLIIMVALSFKTGHKTTR